MMVPFLFSPREHHGVKTAADYGVKHAAFIARKSQRGARYTVHVAADPVVARIDANSWLIDCDCGAGNATDPEWGIAYCYGCGAVHTQIIFPEPETRLEIEAVLVARRDVMRRGWDPAQTVEDLVAESDTAGLSVPLDVRAAIARRQP